jgi:hypothetical protein
MRGRRTRWFLNAALAAALGCADSVSPHNVVGEYVLTRIHGEALPAAVLDNGLVTTVVVADTIRLRADGKGSRTRVMVFTGFATALAVNVNAPTVAATELSFEVVGNMLAITYVCPLNANCSPGPHAIAERTDPGLTITHEGAARVPQEFVSVAR